MSFAEIDRQNIIRYMLPDAWSIGAGPSITYDWEADKGDRLTVPIALGITKTFRLGKVPTKLRAEVHYSVVRPDSFGERWNIRLQITPVIKSPFIKWAHRIPCPCPMRSSAAAATRARLGSGDCRRGFQAPRP